MRTYRLSAKVGGQWGEMGYWPMVVKAENPAKAKRMARAMVKAYRSENGEGLKLLKLGAPR